MKHLRYVSLLLIFLMLVACPARAQEAQEAQEADSLRASRRALSFSFDGFDLGFFEGGVGGKYWLDPNTALRAGVSLNLDLNLLGDDEAENTNYGLGLRVGLERHFGPRGPVSPFVGVVVGVSGYRSTRTLIVSDGTNIRRSERENTSLSGAVDAVLGVEYFVTPHVSLAGEYAVGARLGRTHIERQQTRPDGETERFEDRRTFFDLASRPPTLVVSVYF